MAHTKGSTLHTKRSAGDVVRLANGAIQVGVDGGTPSAGRRHSTAALIPPRKEHEMTSKEHPTTPTENQMIPTIDPAALEVVHGGWLGAAVGLAAGAAYALYSSGHDKGLQKRGHGHPVDSLKDTWDPKNKANLPSSIPVVGPAYGVARDIYKLGEFVGRT